MKTFIKTLPQTLVGLVVLTVITVLGYGGTVAPATTYNLFMGLLTLVGGAGVYIIASNWANSNAFPSLITGLLSLIALVILGRHHVFTSDDIGTTLTLVLLGSATAGVGHVANSATKASINLLVTPESTVPPTPPTPPAPPAPVAAPVEVPEVAA